jgi:acyl carrier protein
MIQLKKKLMKKLRGFLMDEVLEKKIIEICSQAFEVNQKIVTKETSINDLQEWDSLAHLKLILMIESFFELNLDPIEIESINHVSDIIKLVEKNTR